MEDTKCSLPSISNLLKLADAGSHTSYVCSSSLLDAPQTKGKHVSEGRPSFSANGAVAASPFAQHSAWYDDARDTESSPVSVPALSSSRRELTMTPLSSVDTPFDNYNSETSGWMRPLLVGSKSYPRVATLHPESDVRSWQWLTYPPPHIQSPPLSYHSQADHTFMAAHGQWALPQGFVPMNQHADARPADGPNAWQHHHSTNFKYIASLLQSQDQYLFDSCNKTFDRASRLGAPSLRHTGQKPVKCTYPGCKKTFDRRSNMHHHVRACHCASAELEGSRGSEGSARQAGKTRIEPNGGQSDNDSIAVSDVLARIKASDELDHTILASSACGNSCPEQSLASLLAHLQCIREYRASAFDKVGTPYFELECLGQDGHWYWIAESDVQRSVPSAVGTFWGCGPADWIPQDSGGRETGREVWKRPLATDGDGVPDALFIMGYRTSRSGETEFLMQNVGYPAAQPKWQDEETVKAKCTHEYERYRLNQTDYPELMDGEAPQLSAIVGHRLNGEKRPRKGIQLSCQWTNNRETWEAEGEVQKNYNAAVLTYWQSDSNARRSCKVRDQRLQILGHTVSRNKLLLKVQMVGRSSCDGCAICGNLPCGESSTCTPNVPLEAVERLLLKWPETTEKYLENHGLVSYNTKRVQRSERLQCRKD